MDEPASLLTRVNYGIRWNRNIIKQTVRFIPNISPTVISQNQQVRFDLPIGTVDLLLYWAIMLGLPPTAFLYGLSTSKISTP